jgi:hypothetical protein
MTVDELVVELKLDPTNFTKGQRDALDSFKKTNDEFDKGLKNLDTSAKNTGFSFQAMTGAAEGLFAVLAGAGMAAYARDTMNSVAATGRLAHNIGETTGELSAFGRMIERNGGNADAAMGSLKGFSDQITRLNTLGQGSPELFNFLGTIGSEAGEGPLATFMKFAEWAEKHKDNPQLVNLIGTQGGFDQGTINEAMKGRVQVVKDLAEAAKGAVSPEQTAAMIRMQNAWIGLDQAIEKTGRDVVTSAEPAFTAIATSTTSWIERNQKLADSLGEIATAIVGLSALKPAAWLLRLLGFGGAAGALGFAGPLAAAAGLAYANAPTPLGDDDEIDQKTGLPKRHGAADGGTDSAGAFANQQEKEAFIRASAIKAGINPDIAMAVAKSEGFNNFSGDNGTSFGAFQLHVTPGGRGHAVGDQFKDLTRLDPSDPKNEHESIMFAMEWAKRYGWHDFHGAANTGIGDRQGIEAAKGGDVHIDRIVVQTQATDAKGISRDIGTALKRDLHASNITTQANTGLN